MQEYSAAISIAGFDPTGGAGVLADIKVFEAIGVQGCGLVTSLTSQTDISFAGAETVDVEILKSQLSVLLNRFRFPVVKIGYVPSLAYLTQVLDEVRRLIPDTFIIWDPIVRSSSGYDILKGADPILLRNILNKINLITPNKPELEWLEGSYGHEIISIIYHHRHLSAFIKGGHDTGETSIDELLSFQGPDYFESPRLPEEYSKHGSGCVLSSAIAAYLVRGEQLESACRLAKEYTRQYLLSTAKPLGFHRSIMVENLVHE